MIATMREVARPTILLVDDNVEQRDLYALCLEECANVLTAARGDDALHLAMQTIPQAVVLDVHMPGMDGIEVCEQLKRTPATSTIPVVLLTADDNPDVFTRGAEAGACAIMTKPCTSHRLTVTVKDALERVGATGTAPFAAGLRVAAGADIPRLDERHQQLQKMSMLGELAGGIAHDFNNVLTGILGYVDSMMEQLGPDKPIWSDLVEVHRLAESAARLTRPLLTFTRKDGAQVRAFDVNRLVNHTVRVLRRVIGERVQIDTRLKEGAIVTADEAQLEHVLLNLALNARDAMPEGGTVLFATDLCEIGLSDTPGATSPILPGRYVALSVADTGIGMDASTQARIFEPFFTTKPNGRGTGLGLTSVRQTVAAQGGYLAVQSEPGRGSTFTVYLPWTSASLDAAPEAKASLAAAVGFECVLLVEDDGAVRRYASKILRRHGYRVIEAASSEEALTLAEAEQGRIDLVLADVVLPGRQGPALAARLRESWPALKVLYMSGYGDDVVRIADRTDPLAWDRCLGKPFTSATLVQHVRESLDA